MISTVLRPCHASSHSNFDPYVMNGGLLAAIAGRDYMILATDTRLMGSSGYDVLERYHTSSRIWCPVSVVTTATSSCSTTTTSTERDHNNHNHNHWAPDGSMNINLQEELQDRLSSSSTTTTSSLRLLRDSIIHAPSNDQ